jgi:hypothetical protein
MDHSRLARLTRQPTHHTSGDLNTHAGDSERILCQHPAVADFPV